MTSDDERTIDVAGIQTWLRHRPGEGTPVVFWHGNPTDADDWLPFFDATRAPCFAPDLPGFGRSARPSAAEFAYTMDAYGDWATALVDELGLDRFDVVVHDWGAIGLLAAQRMPERVRRIVVLNAVPFGVDYRWHPIARWFWRRRVLGEIFNRAGGSGPAARLLLRQARPGWKPMPASFLRSFERTWSDPVSRDAVLRLYRSATDDALERAGAGLATLEAKTLILWAQQDPYLPATSGRRLAELIPSAELVELEGAGHWSWLDRPDIVATTMSFLEA